MPQSDGNSKLKRISLNLRTEDENMWYNFKVNPEEYTENHPQRSTVFRTREAIVVEDFGPDIATVSFSGTTGFRYIKDSKIEGNRVLNGAARLFRLEHLIEKYSLAGYNTEPGENANKAELILHNQTDGKSWFVHLGEEGFTVTRSVEESLLYRYSIELIILRDTSTPSEREVDDAKIGNPVRPSEYKTSTTYINQAMNPNSKDNIYSEAADNIKDTVGTVGDDKGNVMLPD